ncbi:MAG TPA: PAS domain S-box protein, partial [Actinobacteria bacterium]|nr:PAS domain S-box protein [Actinomycetes bacterium]HEX21589.1 PAS domain S-box protein [Actinomycetota bacterium]
KLNLLNKINNLNKKLLLKYADISRELQVSEHKYHTLFEKANDAIYLLDPTSGRILDCNRKAAELDKRDIDELLTMTVDDLHPADELPLSPLKINNKLRDADGRISGLHHRLSDGRLVPVEINTTLVNIDGKKAILSIVRDITKRTMVREELKKAKNYAENIIEAANAMLIVTDRRGKTMVFNKAAEKISGYSKNKVIGEKISKFFPVGGAIANFELPITTKTGAKRLISWQNSQMKSADKVSGYIFFGIDITEKREAQDKSLNYIKELEILNNIISTISSSLDTDSVLKNTIRSAVNLITGDAGSIALYDSRKSVMKYPYHYNMPEKFKLSIAIKGTGLAEQVMKTGKSIIIEDYPHHPKALPEFVEQGLKVLAAVPIAAKEKNIGALGVFGFSRHKKFSTNDIRILEAVGKEAGVAIENSRLYSELIELSATLEQRVRDRTQALKKANDKLHDLDRLKSMFIASTSHELRTPLNSIIGFSGILLEGWSGKLNPEQKENLKYVYQAGKYLLALINDIIDISKIESGKLDKKMEDFKLKNVVDEAVVSLKTEINEKSLKLTENIEDITMRTDRQRLIQCLVNLISNAVKFTESGEVSLAAKRINGKVDISVS